MKGLYLLIDLMSFIPTLILSFHPRLKFYLYWKELLLAILLTALPFIIWDIWFTSLGVWGFSEPYLTGIKFFNLPLEEVLFFICIPYACLFSYYCVEVLAPADMLSRYHKRIHLSLILLLSITCLSFPGRFYTQLSLGLLVLMLFFVETIWKPRWLGRFLFSYGLLLLPFCLVNGLLTGTGLAEPIVWYNPDHIIGFRLVTIPVEDVFYGMLLVLINVSLFEVFRRKFKLVKV